MNVASAVSSTIPFRTDVGSRALHRYAWGVLAYNILVIVWGAAVRATGSGAGGGPPVTANCVWQAGHLTVLPMMESGSFMAR